MALAGDSSTGIVAVCFGCPMMARWRSAGWALPHGGQECDPRLGAMSYVTTVGLHSLCSDAMLVSFSRFRVVPCLWHAFCRGAFGLSSWAGLGIGAFFLRERGLQFSQLGIVAWNLRTCCDFVQTNFAAIGPKCACARPSCCLGRTIRPSPIPSSSNSLEVVPLEGGFYRHEKARHQRARLCLPKTSPARLP